MVAIFTLEGTSRRVVGEKARFATNFLKLLLTRILITLAQVETMKQEISVLDTAREETH